MLPPLTCSINKTFVLHVVQFTAGFKEASTCRSISITTLRARGEKILHKIVISLLQIADELSTGFKIDNYLMLSTSCTPQSSTVQWSTNCTPLSSTVLLTNLLILPPQQKRNAISQIKGYLAILFQAEGLHSRLSIIIPFEPITRTARHDSTQWKHSIANNFTVVNSISRINGDNGGCGEFHRRHGHRKSSRGTWCANRPNKFRK